MQLEHKLEGVLFYKASPQKKTALLKVFGVSEDELKDAIQKLSTSLKETGLTLIETESSLELATAPELDTLIEQMRKDELKRDIGKAGAETLAIVLYREPVTRSEIDRIRGVNSSYILRNLEMRGLVERSSEGRQNTYTISTELLRHLGIGNKTDLKDYATVLDALERYEKQESEDNE